MLCGYIPMKGLIKLFRNTAWNIDSGLVLLAQAAVPFDTTSFHNVQLSFKGTQISVLYDGRTIITATDATYSKWINCAGCFESSDQLHQCAGNLKQCRILAP